MVKNAAKGGAGNNGGTVADATGTSLGVAQLSDFETFIRDDILAFIGADLSSMSVADSVAVSGVNVYDENDFLATMAGDGSYECMVPLGVFDFKKFTHGTNVPTIGTIVRAVKTLLPTVSTAMPSTWQTMAIPITVRTSQLPPSLTDLVPSALDEKRIACALQWAWAVKDKNASHAAECKRLYSSMRVRFEFIADEDKALQDVWNKTAVMMAIAESVQLVGIRRTLAVMDVVSLLKRRGKVTAKSVAEWFSGPQGVLATAGVSADDDMSLTHRKIEQHMRVNGRLQYIVDELLLMESIYGIKHSLISPKLLETILGMTAVESSITSHALLRYGVRGIIVSTLRGQLSVVASALQVKHALHEWLFVQEGRFIS
jgi:hypothetical protein